MHSPSSNGAFLTYVESSFDNESRPASSERPSEKKQARSISSASSRSSSSLKMREELSKEDEALEAILNEQDEQPILNDEDLLLIEPIPDADIDVVLNDSAIEDAKELEKNKQIITEALALVENKKEQQKELETYLTEMRERKGDDGEKLVEFPEDYEQIVEIAMNLQSKNADVS